MTQIYDFLSALWRGGNKACWWTDPNRQSYWFSSDDPKAARKKFPKAKNQNIYFGIHPVTQIPPTNSRGEQAPIDKIRSQNEYIACINCVYAEFDSLEEINTSISPSVIVFSGGGYHCYWLLDETFYINSADDLSYAKKLQAQWVAHVDSDPASKDLSRVLRVPGTLNLKPKYGPDFPTVEFRKCELELRYAIKDFEVEPIVIDEPRPVIDTSNIKIKDAWFNSAIDGTLDDLRNAANGTRNDTLNRVAFRIGQFVPHAISQTEAESLILDAGFAVGLHENEINATMKGAIYSGMNKADYGPQDKIEKSMVVTQTKEDAPEDIIDSAALNEPLTLDGILSAIEAISKTDKAGHLSALRVDVSDAIGDIDRTTHAEIEQALIDHLDMTQTGAKSYTRDCRASAKRRHKEKANAARVETQAERLLPQIRVNDRQLRDIADDAYLAIVARNKEAPATPCLYVRGGILQRIAQDEDNRPVLQAISDRALLGIMARVADWITISEKDGIVTEREASVDREALNVVLGLGSWPDLPPLYDVVRCPILGADMQIHDSPGYNPATKTFYANPIALGDTEPTEENLIKAKDLILDGLLSDFPFADEASKAHAVALLLLPFVRHAIRGATPLHLIDAPMPGSGKGLLTDACAIPSTGRTAPAMSAPTDEAEWNKSLTAALMRGNSHISIDNVVGELSSASLAKFITQSEVEERILGASQMVNLKILATWAANGNNVFVDTDMARRIAWIRLAPLTERPSLRDGFKHNDLRTWALEHREELATAAITMIRKWLADESPPFNGRPKGSFESWATVMGGILQANGIDGFLGNEDDLYEASADSAEAFKDFVTAWHEEHGCDITSVNDLFLIAGCGDEIDIDGRYRNLLEELLGAGKERSRRTRLGRELKKAVGKVFELVNEHGNSIGSFRIEKASRSKVGARWKLVEVGAALEELEIAEAPDDILGGMI